MNSLFHLRDINDLITENNSVNCFLLFAVLTCIPSNNAQKKLIATLFSKLKPNGIIYLSDYYLQEDRTEVKDYGYLNGDKNNFGTFSLPEGATFRHHTKEWIEELTCAFTIKEHTIIEVKTMNGSNAKAFQMILQKA